MENLRTTRASPQATRTLGGRNMHGINQDRMRKPGKDGHPFVFASGGGGTTTWLYQ